MKINIKDLVTLSDNNKYAVCSKTNYNDNDYLYLMDIVDNTNIKFCMEKPKGDKISVVEIENPELIQALLPLFFNEAKDILKEFEES